MSEARSVREKDSGKALSVRGLRITLPGGQALLEDVCLDVAAGEVVVLLGGSGAGKSTLSRVLLERHELERHGFNVVAEAIDFDPAHLGLVPQRGALFDHVDVRGNLELALRYAGGPGQASSPADWLARVGLDPALAAPGTPVGRLSGGQAQRLAVARALAGRRRLLLLDEPSVGLDPHRVRELARLVRAQVDGLGLAAIVITHDVALAAGVADRVYLLSPRTRRLEPLFEDQWPGPVEAPAVSDEVRGQWLLALERALVAHIAEDAQQDTEPPNGQEEGKEAGQKAGQEAGQEDTREDTRRARAAAPGRVGPRLRALAELVLRPFAVCATALCHLPGHLARRPGDFVAVGRRVLAQALARPLPFYAVVSVLLGYTVLLVIGKVGGAGVRPDALIRQIGGSHVVALAPALSAMLFVAASGSATNAWLGSMTLTRQTLAMEALGIPSRAYLWSPAWLCLGLAYLATAALFALGMIAGGLLVCAQHGMTDGWALLTGDVVDPRPERVPYAVRAGFSCWIYAWGIASDVVARGTAAKPDADAVTRGMTASVVACTLWIVLWELFTVLVVFSP